MTTMLVSEIVVEDRQRLDLGDIDELAASIAAVGLLQPLLVNQNKRLVDGGRRLTAVKKLGWTEVPVFIKEVMTERQLTVYELLANIMRKSMTWKEEVAAVAKVHRLRSTEAALASEDWTQEMTGRLMNMSRASVGFMLTVARELRDQTSKVHDCDGFTDALRFCIRKQEDMVQADIARQMKAQMEVNRAVLPSVAPTKFVENADGILVAQNPIPEGDLIVEPVGDVRAGTQVIDLSSTIVQADCLTWLGNRAPESVDHILTDPPYAIDMEMLDQNNPHGGMVDIRRIEETHRVDENLDLIARFLPLAFKVLKSKGFCVIFCDIMRWQFIYDRATEVGFRVQRWPFVWHKTHQCMNQRAEYNFTKNVEFAIVMRKAGSVLTMPQNSTIFSCSGQGYISNPFAKPFELWSKLIEAISIKGQTILDPFAGEGSCPSAVIGYWRFPIAIELDPNHYNVMLEEVRKKYDLLYRKPTYI